MFTVHTQSNLRHNSEVYKKEGTTGKVAKHRQTEQERSHITAVASCKCRATHVRKVRNSNIVQIPREAAGAGCASQKTGHRAAVVLLWPPGGETEQQRKPKRFSPGPNFQKKEARVTQLKRLKSLVSEM